MKLTGVASFRFRAVATAFTERPLPFPKFCVVGGVVSVDAPTVVEATLVALDVITTACAMGAAQTTAARAAERAFMFFEGVWGVRGQWGYSKTPTKLRDEMRFLAKV
ncbi:hypothetical protein HAHE_10700 [Haloferula helveola]|uniref:Uncharacterized protein n=1 Tax=Haloferula helveola TaxID=490095 RepID=A0ABM7R861_9BACT|nr:hypothetical protein HAHE_10700 [Haloferula helveola]